MSVNTIKYRNANTMVNTVSRSMPSASSRVYSAYMTMQGVPMYRSMVLMCGMDSLVNRDVFPDMKPMAIKAKSDATLPIITDIIFSFGRIGR